jgi:Protein of unknown function (DUF2795)
MAYAIAAELQVVLEGVPLPAAKQELLHYAQSQDADERLLNALRSVPDREYSYLDEVGEALTHVQPVRVRLQPRTPSEDSDAVPGGEDYMRTPTDTGRVRDTDRAVEEQKQLG